MTIILGAGISGISSGYHLNKKGIENIIYEKDDDWGGLCGNFEVDGFRFDKAIHLSFTENEYVKEVFSKSCDYYTHKPEAYNFYHGYWLKHPAQNNLYNLPAEEKVKIITGFIEDKTVKKVTNYEDWLKTQYGNYFAENFPLVYTKKYWCYEAKDLSTTWVGDRMYRPNLEEVLYGSFSEETPNNYYAKEMRYPKKGGYRSFLKGMFSKCAVELSKKVIEIDTNLKEITFADGDIIKYDNLISSLPLPELINVLKDTPEHIKKLANKLQYTSIGLVSIGLNKAEIPNHLWFYIYDEDIQASRCYSPSIKSPDNVPKNCSSLQFEIYFNKEKPLKYNGTKMIEHVIEKSISMKVFERKDVLVQDFRILKYANVVFYHDMERDREKILTYIKELDIKTVGRFGKWEYFWSDQSLLSGKSDV